jgi:multiple antibiotic resistance protein
MFKTLYLQFLFGGLVSLLGDHQSAVQDPAVRVADAGHRASCACAAARMACAYAAAIMLVCLLAGNLILAAFGISFGALRIAGGFVVAVLGYRMLFLSQDPGMAPKTNRREDYLFFRWRCRASAALAPSRW